MQQWNVATPGPGLARVNIEQHDVLIIHQGMMMANIVAVWIDVHTQCASMASWMQLPGGQC